MEKLINLKLIHQHSKNIYIDFEKSNGSNRSESEKLTVSYKAMKGKIGAIYEPAQNPNDCYMVILNPWTACSLACGGGKSYLQLMKIEAKNGGKDCKTKETVLNRDCNVQPCPKAIKISSLIQPKESNSYAKSITVKIMPISNRPERYEKCHLKETDALMEKNDDSTKDMPIKPLIPVRLVMNEKTLTAYLNDDLTNLAVTYLLEQSDLIPKGDNKCFVIQNNIKSNKFCILDSVKGSFVDEWSYDFNLFKIQCSKNRPKSNVVFTEKQKLEEEFKNKVEHLKIEVVQEKSEQMKKQVQVNEKQKLVSKVDDYRKISINAIEKEMRLEDLLEKEEENREESETHTLETQIEKEMKKEECLNKSIKQKEIENQFNVAKAQAQRAIQQIAKTTQTQISKQRTLIAKKLIEMRQKQSRKKAELTNHIFTIRTQIAQKLQKINKYGSDVHCTNYNEKVVYCNKNFPDNYFKYQECLSNDTFCYICCENEFGDMHILQRDDCYNKCDTTPIPK